MFDHASMQPAAGERDPCRDAARAGQPEELACDCRWERKLHICQIRDCPEIDFAFWLQGDPNSRL
jgi:hypothetical protein